MAKVEATEKSLKAEQCKFLDVARSLLYLKEQMAEGELKNSPMAEVVDVALRLWGNTFHGITVNRRENLLKVSDAKYVSLFKEPQVEGYQIFLVEKLNPPSICPVRCHERYVSLTQSFRGSISSLILGIKSPHAPIGASSIARWIKSVLADAEIDISVYSAHSTGAAASKAKSSRLLIDTIRKLLEIP